MSHEQEIENVSFLTFIKLYFRSFFIQGSFSEKFRQNTGFAFCMEPVGRDLWQNPEDYKDFLIRHMEYYNGNPFMITLVLGAVARLEEILRNGGEMSPKQIAGFKKAVGAAIGSLGDRFFWGTLRPFGILLGLLVSSFYGIWCVVITLIIFNTPNLLLRAYWLKRGYQLGTGVVCEIKNRHLETAINTMEKLSAVMVSFVAATLIWRTKAVLSGATSVTVILFFLGYFLFRRNKSVSYVLTLSAGIAVITGIVIANFLH